MGVLGIGGLFFRARNPEVLTNWYREHLNVGPGCSAIGAGEASDEWSWMAQGGPVVFTPFPEDSNYFAQDKPYMLNLRVGDLAALIAQLKAAGISVETRDEWNDPNVGQFARIHDPEGNPIELWQPPGG